MFMCCHQVQLMIDILCAGVVIVAIHVQENLFIISCNPCSVFILCEGINLTGKILGHFPSNSEKKKETKRKWRLAHMGAIPLTLKVLYSQVFPITQNPDSLLVRFFQKNS